VFVFKPSFAVNAFCGLYALIGIIDTIIYLDIGAPVDPTISSISPSWHLFLCCVYGLQWYGKRFSTKIANRDAAILNREFPDDLRQIAKQGQSLAIWHPVSFVFQQKLDISRLFDLHEYINKAFQVARVCDSASV
jgi:hypothetical protein